MAFTDNYQNISLGSDTDHSDEIKWLLLGICMVFIFDVA